MTTIPSSQDLTTALEVLLWLSEAREGEGRLRDSIALVRSELHEEVDRAGYGPCNHECNGCPTCDPGLTSDLDALRARVAAVGEVLDRFERSATEAPHHVYAGPWLAMVDDVRNALGKA